MDVVRDDMGATEEFRNAFQITVNSYDLEHASAWFAATLKVHKSVEISSQVINLDKQAQERCFLALSQCSKTYPIFVLYLPLADPLTVNQGSMKYEYTESQVRLFFDLVGELKLRTSSEDNMTTESGRLRMEEKEKARSQTLQRARVEFLAMHAMAVYFQCKLVLRWLKCGLLNIINDSIATMLLDCIFTWKELHGVHSENPIPISIQDECADLYKHILLWYSHLRPPSITPSDPLRLSMLAIRNYVNNHDTHVDIYQPRLEYAHNFIRFRGSLVKCTECSDQCMPNHNGNTLATMIHMSNEVASKLHGHWSIFLNEARNCSGVRSLIIRRLGTRLVQDKPSSFFTSPSMVNVCEFMASVQGSPKEEPEMGYECSASVEFIKRTDHHFYRPSDRTQFRSPAFQFEGRSLISKYVIALPEHWRTEEYYTGYCPRCKQIKKVAIMLYDISIVPCTQQQTKENNSQCNQSMVLDTQRHGVQVMMKSA